MSLTTHTIHVYLVDDHDAFRQSLAWLLEDSGFSITEFSTGRSLLAELETTQPPANPACILTDLRMPAMSGLELMEALRVKRCRIPLVMMTGHGDIPLAVEAMRRGAVHFLEKPFSEDRLIGALHDAISQPGNQLKNPDASRARLAALSTREREVLELVCSALPNKRIADRLGISVKTVELHRANIAHKLETRSVQDLIKLSLGYDA